MHQKHQNRIATNNLCQEFPWSLVMLFFYIFFQFCIWAYQNIAQKSLHPSVKPMLLFFFIVINFKSNIVSSPQAPYRNACQKIFKLLISFFEFSLGKIRTKILISRPAACKKDKVMFRYSVSLRCTSF